MDDRTVISDDVKNVESEARTLTDIASSNVVMNGNRLGSSPVIVLVSIVKLESLLSTTE